MSELTIRIYQPRDLEALLPLAQELDSELAKRSNREANPGETRQFYENYYLRTGNKYQVLVASSLGGIEGYVVGSPVFGFPEANRSQTIDPSTAKQSEVSIVFVTKASRRKKIGRKLVLSLMEHVKKTFHHKGMQAYVAKWNDPSIALFRSLGSCENEEEDRFLYTQEL